MVFWNFWNLVNETFKKYSYGDSEENLELYQFDDKKNYIENFFSKEKLHKEEIFMNFENSTDNKQYIIDLFTEPNRSVVPISIKINFKTNYKGKFKMYLNLEFDNGEMVMTECTYKGNEMYEFYEKFTTSSESVDYFSNDELVDIFDKKMDFFNSNSMQVVCYEKLLKSKNSNDRILRNDIKVPDLYSTDYNGRKMIQIDTYYLKIIKNHFENHKKRVNFLKTKRKNPEYTERGKERILSCLLKPENFIIISLEKEDSEITEEKVSNENKIEKVDEKDTIKPVLDEKKEHDNNKDIKNNISVTVTFSYIVINKSILFD